MATGLLEKPEAREAMPLQDRSAEAPPEFHWTVDALYQAIDANIFDHPERLELIHGRIIENMAQGGPHTGLRRRIGRRLRETVEPIAFVCEECPLRLALDGEPVPDVILTRKADYGDQHPTQEDAVLVVEVAASSAEYDLGEKSRLYAEANIQDYWVALVNENAVVVHRQPMPEGYAEVTRLAGTDTLSPLALPETVWTVDTLLGRAAEAQQ